jgi:hypothetical protein
VDARIRHGRAESRKRRRPEEGGGAPDEYPPPTDVEPLVGPIRKQARIVGESSNGPLVEESALNEWAKIYDALREAPEIGPQEAVHHQEMMATFTPKSDAYLTQIARWEKHDRERQYYPRIPNKVQPGMSMPFFCLDAVQRFSAWLLVEHKMATLEPVGTAMNNYYDSHGYGRRVPRKIGTPMTKNLMQARTKFFNRCS